MKIAAQTLVGEFESILWIRVEGRGTFQVSPLIKELAERELAAGRLEFVIDLEACSGMDSTFMGMMAGIGMKLKKLGEGQLSVVGTSEKSRESLEELGLTYLMEIEPERNAWDDHLAEIRANVIELDEAIPKAREEHILECHETLCDADESNVDRFKTVLDVMGSKKTSPGNDKPD